MGCSLDAKWGKEVREERKEERCATQWGAKTFRSWDTNEKEERRNKRAHLFSFLFHRYGMEKKRKYKLKVVHCIECGFVQLKTLRTNINKEEGENFSWRHWEIHRILLICLQCKMSWLKIKGKERTESFHHFSRSKTRKVRSWQSVKIEV